MPAEYTTPADDFFSGPALLNDTLFVGNYDNHLYALDTRTGRFVAYVHTELEVCEKRQAVKTGGQLELTA